MTEQIFTNTLLDNPSSLGQFTPTRHESPYPGLRPFFDDERDLFFGRDTQIVQVVRRLGERNVAAILGGSGCGKSSLVRAGVIPELRSYGIPGRSDTWVPVTFTPGEAPIKRLALALNRALVPSDSEPERIETIKHMLMAPRSLSTFLEEYQNELKVDESVDLNLGPHVNLLVVIDQFEEVFRPQSLDTAQTERLIDLITETYDEQNDRVYLILTMRSEFIDRCANYVRLADVLNSVSYLTRRLKREELEEVIVQPASRYLTFLLEEKGLGFAIQDNECWPFDEKVKNRLMREVAELSSDTDHLPLLQHLLFWLWKTAYERWEGSHSHRDFRIMEQDLADAAKVQLDSAGSLVRRSLNNRAQSIFASLTPAQQTIAERMFRLLAEVDGKGVYKRRWTNRKEILGLSNEPASTAMAEDVDHVLRVFAKPHAYLRTEIQAAADRIIDVSHEAFIRNWNQFKQWLSTEREARCVYLELLKDSSQWQVKRSYLKRLCVYNPDLLTDKEIDPIDRLKLKELGFNWARRYNEEYYDELVRHGEIAKKPKDIDYEGLYKQAINYYGISKRILRDKRLLKRMGIPLFTVVVAVLSTFLVTSRFETSRANFEANAFDPYAVVNSFRGSAVDEVAEEGKRIRIWQLAVALKSMDIFQTDMEKKDIKGEPERMRRLELLWRLTHKGAVDAVREALGSAFLERERPTDIGENRSEHTAPYSEEANQACIDQVLGQTRDNTLKRHKQITPLRGAPQPDRDWHPILLRVEGRMHFGFQTEKDGRCYPIDPSASKDPLPVKGKSYHDSRLQLVLFETGAEIGSKEQRGWNVYRLHWYDFCDKKNTHPCPLNQRQFRVQHRWFGWLEAPPTVRSDQGGDSLDVSLAFSGMGFWINWKTETGEEKKQRYDVRWVDTFQPVSEDSRRIEAKYFTSAPQGSEFAAQNDGARPVDGDQLCHDPEFIRKFMLVGQDEQRTACALDSTPNGNRYVAYVTAARDSRLRDRQRLTVLDLGTTQGKTSEKHTSVAEIGAISFERPPIEALAFGSGEKDDGLLFFKTEDQQYYQAFWGMKRMRTELCDALPSNDWRPKDDVALKEIFQFFLAKGKEGLIYRSAQEGPCVDLMEAAIARDNL